MAKRYRGSPRPIIPGNIGVSVSAYNKIDPVNPAVVTQNFKGPFQTNPTYSHGEELWIKFSSPKYLTTRDAFISLLLNVSTVVPYFQNYTAPEQPTPSTYYRGGVWAQLVYSDFDPAALCFNNAPFYFGTDDDFIPRDTAGGTANMTLASQDIFGLQLLSMPVGTRYFAGARYDGTVQMRQLGVSLGFPTLVGEDNSSGILSEVFALLPTTISFKPDLGVYTGGQNRDDYFNGWLVVVVGGSGPAVGESSYVASYNGTSHVITLASAFSVAPVVADTLLLLIPPIRGVRFFTYAAGGSDLANPPTGSGQFPFFYWPGVDAVQVLN